MVKCWDHGEINGEQLSDSARRVQRYLRGSFVFFSTTSIYNQVPDTYDARHNEMTEDQFRQYIERSANHSREKKSQIVYVWHPFFNKEVYFWPKLFLLMLGQLSMVTFVVALCISIAKRWLIFGAPLQTQAYHAYGAGLDTSCSPAWRALCANENFNL
jgi:hypothetical protein